jgi:hypothetical protein
MLRVLVAALALPTILLTTGAAWAGNAIVPVSTPEPASLLLLAGGVAGVVAAKRLRRRR